MVKRIFYGILSITFFMVSLLFLLGTSLLPVIRQFTVVNNTQEVFQITPLLEAGKGLEGHRSVDGEAENSVIQKSEFSVLGHYLFYSNPTFPSLQTKDLSLKPFSKIQLYIDYEDIKQEQGIQVVLLKNKEGEYFYIEADFWESTVLSRSDQLKMATPNMIKAKEASSGGGVQWGILGAMLLLSVGFASLFEKSLKHRSATRDLPMR